MDRIWQWAWDRYATRYTRATLVVVFFMSVPIYLLLTLSIVASEKSGRYLEVAALTVAAVLVLEFLMFFPGRREMGRVQKWAAGEDADRAALLEGTYAYSRRMSTQIVWTVGVWATVLSAVVAAMAGATGCRIVQYGVLGAAFGIGVQLIAFHSVQESILRPVRAALAGETGIGDSLPRSSPSFAARSNVSMVAVAFVFGLTSATLAVVVARAVDAPVLVVVIAGALALGFAAPISVGLGFSARLRRRSTACRPVWRSGSGCRPRSAPTSTRPWPPGFSSRTTTSSPVNAGR